jgi:hypothetical protein
MSAVQRVSRTPQGLDGTEKIAGMGLMGFGGLIAVIGGVMFLAIVLRSVLRGRDRREG